jgi:hypothetical protein
VAPGLGGGFINDEEESSDYGAGEGLGSDGGVRRERGAARRLDPATQAAVDAIDAEELRDAFERHCGRHGHRVGSAGHEGGQSSERDSDGVGVGVKGDAQGGKEHEDVVPLNSRQDVVTLVRTDSFYPCINYRTCHCYCCSCSVDGLMHASALPRLPAPCPCIP